MRREEEGKGVRRESEEGDTWRAAAQTSRRRQKHSQMSSCSSFFYRRLFALATVDASSLEKTILMPSFDEEEAGARRAARETATSVIQRRTRARAADASDASASGSCVIARPRDCSESYSRFSNDGPTSVSRGCAAGCKDRQKNESPLTKALPLSRSRWIASASPRPPTPSCRPR